MFNPSVCESTDSCDPFIETPTPVARPPDVAAMIGDLLDRQDLSTPDSDALFSALVNGRLGEIETSAACAALKVKGETTNEIIGAARALRRAAEPFAAPDYAFADSCGTGGDGAGTINISTAVAFAVAACGLPVAKHANRSVSSACGSLDVMEAMGARIEVPAPVARRCLDKVGVCILNAPQYHRGIRHAMPVRCTLGVRTIFNLLGPLINPARPAFQLVGVYESRLCRPLAQALAALGTRAALVVHGSGLDEIALHGPTRATLLRDGALTDLEITPEEAGLARAPRSALTGAGADENARRIRRILGGAGRAPERAAIALNAGALLWLAGRAESLRAGADRVLDVLASGAPLARFNRYVEISHAA